MTVDYKPICHAHYRAARNLLSKRYQDGECDAVAISNQQTRVPRLIPMVPQETQKSQQEDADMNDDRVVQLLDNLQREQGRVAPLHSDDLEIVIADILREREDSVREREDSDAEAAGKIADLNGRVEALKDILRRWLLCTALDVDEDLVRETREVLEED